MGTNGQRIWIQRLRKNKYISFPFRERLTFYFLRLCNVYEVSVWVKRPEYAFEACAYNVRELLLAGYLVTLACNQQKDYVKFLMAFTGLVRGPGFISVWCKISAQNISNFYNISNQLVSFYNNVFFLNVYHYDYFYSGLLFSPRKFSNKLDKCKKKSTSHISNVNPNSKVHVFQSRVSL